MTTRCVLVKFGNGLYGLQLGWWPYRKFQDLKQDDYKYDMGSSYFADCQGTWSEAMLAFNRLAEREKAFTYTALARLS